MSLGGLASRLARKAGTRLRVRRLCRATVLLAEVEPLFTPLCRWLRAHGLCVERIPQRGIAELHLWATHTANRVPTRTVCLLGQSADFATLGPGAGHGADRVGAWIRCSVLRAVPILSYGWQELDPSSTAWFLPDRDRHVRLPLTLQVLHRELMRTLDCGPLRRDDTLALGILSDQAEACLAGYRHDYKGFLASLRLLLGAYLDGDLEEEALTRALRDLDAATDEPRLRSAIHCVQVSSKLSAPEPARTVFPVTGHVLVVEDSLAARRDQPAGAHGHDSGWGVVYETLLGKSRPFSLDSTLAGSAALALQEFTSHDPCHYRLAIVDADLGERQPSGLDLLRTLRRIDPFLPVLVNTAFDSGPMVRASFMELADAYFAKELESGRPDSRRYWQQFRAALHGVLVDEHGERELFHQFLRKLPEVVRADADAGRTPPEKGVAGDLLQVFLLLRLQQCGNTGALRLLALDVAEEGALLEIAALLYTAGRLWLGCSRKGLSLAGYDVLCRVPLTAQGLVSVSGWVTVDRSHHSAQDFFGIDASRARGMAPADLLGMDCQRLNCLGGHEHEVRSCALPNGCTVDLLADGERKVRICSPSHLRSPEMELADALLPLAGTRHGCGGLTLDLATLLRVMGMLLDLIPDAPGEGSPTPPRMERPPTHLSKLLAQARRADSRGSHGVRSKMGAEGLLLSLYAEPPQALIDDLNHRYNESGEHFPAHDVLRELALAAEETGATLAEVPDTDSVPRVLLVDDHGWENGWALVSQLALNDAVVLHHDYAGPNDTNWQGYIPWVDLVLLDLHMPDGESISVQGGLEVLKQIRAMDPLLPVVALSAQLDSRTVKEAIQQGAFDYLMKERPDGSSWENVKAYGETWQEVTRHALSERAMGRTCRRLLRLIAGRECGEFLARYSELFEATHPCWPNLEQRLAEQYGWDAPTPADVLAIFRTQVAAHLRRAMFYHSLRRRPYVSEWLEAFTVSSGRQGIQRQLRLSRLAFDRYWQNTSAIGEMLCTVACFSGGCRETDLTLPNHKGHDGNDAIGRCCDVDAALRMYNNRETMMYRDEQPRIDPQEQVALLERLLQSTSDYIAPEVVPAIFPQAEIRRQAVRQSLALAAGWHAIKQKRADIEQRIDTIEQYALTTRGQGVDRVEVERRRLEGELQSLKAQMASMEQPTDWVDRRAELVRQQRV